MKKGRFMLQCRALRASHDHRCPVSEKEDLHDENCSFLSRIDKFPTSLPPHPPPPKEKKENLFVPSKKEEDLH
jgi:hypothetical protein